MNKFTLTHEPPTELHFFLITGRTREWVIARLRAEGFDVEDAGETNEYFVDALAEHLIEQGVTADMILSERDDAKI